MPPNSFADATTGFTALWNADMERRSAIFPEPAMISQYESANGYTEDNDWMFNDEWQNFDRFDPGPHRSPLPDRPGSASSSIIGDGWSKHEPMDETLPKVYTLDAPLTQEAFLEWYPYGNATLTFTNDQNKLQSIPNVNLELIGQQSVLLALAFEDLRAGPQLHLETLTSATAFPFLRFLYTGTYALTEPTGDWYEDVPTSVSISPTSWPCRPNRILNRNIRSCYTVSSTTWATSTTSKASRHKPTSTSSDKPSSAALRPISPSIYALRSGISTSTYPKPRD